MTAVMDKENLDNEDKSFLLQFVEEKERLCFGNRFPATNISWIVSK